MVKLRIRWLLPCSLAVMAGFVQTPGPTGWNSLLPRSYAAGK